MKQDETRTHFRILFILFAAFLFSSAVSADVLDTIGGINNLLYGVAAGIAALMITLHAIRWKTAGSPSERDEAKRGIINVILGLIIIILAATIVSLIYMKSQDIPGTKNCDQLDGWYTTKALGPTCFGNDLCTDTVERTERDYSLSGGSCIYTDKQAKTECSAPVQPCPAGQTCASGVCAAGGVPSCDMLDGWYTTKTLGPTCIGEAQCTDTVERTERDYFQQGTSCSYTDKQTKTECASTLKNCPAGQKCANGMCAEIGTTTTSTSTTTRRPTTTRKPTTTTTTTTTSTTTSQPLLTAKNLVDCINSKKGRLYTWYNTAQHCEPCIQEAENVFFKENFPDGQGKDQYNLLTKPDSGSPTGSYPCWYWPGQNKKEAGCQTLKELNDWFACSLTPVTEHAYYCCSGSTGC